MGRHKHHGGSWKVAYADFVTAMMALFLVLWLTAQDSRIKEAIERAFRNPFSSVTKESVGIIPNKDATALEKQRGDFDSASATQMELLRRITQDLSKLLEQNPEPENNVKLELTPDGLRINIFDRSRRPIFEPDSVTFTSYGTWVFSTLAWEISRYRAFTVELEGHTETGYKPRNDSYGGWELSADRANAARRKLLEHGVDSAQICEVAGFGDIQPMRDTRPTDAINRRVSVLLKVRNPDQVGEATTRASETVKLQP